MEEILYILLVIGAFIGGTVYGWGLRERHAQRRLDSLMEKFESVVEKELKDSLIPIKIEKHKEAFYVFNKDTDEFMGQGNTRKELEDALAKRYPNKRFAASPENLKVFNESF